MRNWFILLLLFLAGCAAQQPIPPQVTERVQPIKLELLQEYRYEPYADYLLPLLANLAQEPFYTLNNPRRLKGGYAFSHEVSSSDQRKSVLALKSLHTSHWGYVTTGIGHSGIANAFLIENKALGTAYALVLKQMKICLVTQAAGAPVWQSGKWRFSSQPGYFECTGMTNKNIFRVGMGLPAILGPYYSEKDTLLVFRELGQLQQVVSALKRQFPQMKIPVIQ